MFHPVFRIAGCQAMLAEKTEGRMVVDQTVGDPVIAMLTHGVAKMVERLLCRLRRHDPFNISLQIFHYRNSPLAMARYYCNLRMYADIYRNQPKNGRIWHKIAEIGRIAIRKFTKRNRREIVSSPQACAAPATEFPACQSGKSIRQFGMIGYAKVSTTDQHLNLQRDALKTAGCRKIFADQGVSGSAVTRPQLARALEALRPGDTLVVWKLDRLGRSLSHLVMTIADLGKRGVNFRSLTESIDTESAGGRFMVHIIAALAEFERSRILERTRAGLDAAIKRGIRLGRTPRLDEKKVAKARCLLKGGESPRDRSHPSRRPFDAL